MYSENTGFSKQHKKLILISVITLIMFISLSSLVKLINPGHVGVLIQRSGGGVATKPLGVGFHIKLPIVQEIEEYPVYMQTLVLTRDPKE
ncbi:MAG: hypothetical protein FD167_4109, partial [bacterium]